MDDDASGETGLESTLSGAGPEPAASLVEAEPSFARGSTVGRYTVLERIGAGGMGVVYSAFDPQLDRRVALKIMHPGRVGLLREAQAMARLSHPNVITVHDVGTHADQVFVAMEFVDGSTLRAWLRSGHHEWSAVVHAFVRAGRGLAAAHAAGLVHRDFKPDNVLMGRDGRVLVMDFGLARVATRRGPAAPLTESSSDSLSSLANGSDLLLTRTGAMYGTPAYMAPEQHRGAEVGPLADQFSFCVALYEGLYGERPFAGNTLTSIAMHVLEGTVRPPPRDTRVPAWLRQVLLRGLRTDPSERYPSMDALLAELQREPPPKSRPVLALGVAAAVASTIVAGYLLTRAPVDRRCHDGDDPLASTWNEARREQVRDAFLRSPSTYAEATWQTVDTRLERYAERWTATFTARCELAARSRPARAGPDPGLQCLDDRTRELEALLHVFVSTQGPRLTADPNRAVLEHAAAAVERLPAPEPCETAREAELVLHGPSGPEHAAAVTALEHAIAEARARVHTGDHDTALRKAAALVSSATAVESPAHEAEALLLVAEARIGLVRESSERGMSPPVRQRELRSAEWSLRRALIAAAKGHRADLEAWAWLRQIPIVGLELGRPDEAGRLALGAEAAIERMGEDDHELRAALALALGAIDQADGRHEDALDHFRQALLLRGTVFAPDDLRVAEAHAAVGLALEGMSRFTEAIEEHNADLAARERVLGVSHPDVAASLARLASAQLGAGYLEAAMASLVRARLLVESESDGLEHARLHARILDQLGLVRRAGEQFEEAARLHTQALALGEARLGADAPELGCPIENLGLALTDAGRPREALVHLERALTLWNETLAADHPVLGIAHLNLANALWATEQPQAARDHYAKALAIWEDGLPPEHPLLAYALTGIGRTELELAAMDGAVDVLERAYALRNHASEDPLNVAETSLLLARALWATGRDMVRALDLVVAARDIVGAFEPRDAVGLRRVLAGGAAPRFTENLAPAGLGTTLRRFSPE